MIQTGLKKQSIWGRIIKNGKNFSYHKTFGVSPADQIPDEYLLLSPILDQGPEPKCTGFSSVAIREAQEGIPFDPHFFYAKEGEVNGKISNSGYDIKTMMKTGCNGGFVPHGQPISTPQYNQARYFEIQKTSDVFDGIRSAMWKGRDEKMCASIGIDWKRSWIYDPIPKDNSLKDYLGYHAFKGAGWTRKKINWNPKTGEFISFGDWINPQTKEVHLVKQGSWGEGVGDKGLFYFSRAMVNKFWDYRYCWSEKADESQIKTIGLLINLMQQLVALLVKLKNLAWKS